MGMRRLRIKKKFAETITQKRSKTTISYKIFETNSSFQAK